MALKVAKYTESKSKETNMPKTKKSIVFCHGLWADDSCFSKLILPLQAEGYECIATQHGLNTTAEDVALTKATIGRVSNPVILVGHSYGGSVITGAGTDDRGWTYLAASGGHQVFLRRSFGAGAEARLGDPRRAETRSFRGKSRGNCLEVEAELVYRRQKGSDRASRSGAFLRQAHGCNHF